MSDVDRERLLEPFYRRLGSRDVLTVEEKQAIVQASDQINEYDAKTDLIHERDLPNYSTLVLEGITARCSVVEDGGRQITAFHIPGDFVDLESFVLKPMDHTITAMTKLKVMTFPHAKLKVITEEHPHLTRMLWFITLLDGATHRQWLVAMGRMKSVEHMAHLFCEHFLRAEAAGLAKERSFPFHVTQADFADALGLSAVHTNRSLNELRRRELIEWDGRTVKILDWNRLQRVAMFDPTYLHLGQFSV